MAGARIFRPGFTLPCWLGLLGSITYEKATASPPSTVFRSFLQSLTYNATHLAPTLSQVLFYAFELLQKTKHTRTLVLVGLSFNSPFFQNLLVGHFPLLSSSAKTKETVSKPPHFAKPATAQSLLQSADPVCVRACVPDRRSQAASKRARYLREREYDVRKRLLALSLRFFFNKEFGYNLEKQCI